MKLINQLNVFMRYLTLLNYAGLNLNETPKELEQYQQQLENFWDKECREHPTNQNCLIYFDWAHIFSTISQPYGFTPWFGTCAYLSKGWGCFTSHTWEG